jgi:hypothetical protein
MSYNFTYLNLYLKYRGSSFKIKKDHYVISKVAARHMSTDDLDSVLVVAYPSPSPSSPRPPHHRPSSSSTIEDVPPPPPQPPRRAGHLTAALHHCCWASPTLAKPGRTLKGSMTRSVSVSNSIFPIQIVVSLA